MKTRTSPTCRVLYVEDTREDQQILREAIDFADVPVELITANTAQSALKLLSNGDHFHILLLDWNLPAVTGLEFLTNLRAAQPTVPVIILTGEPRLVDTPTAKTLGARTILKKPLILEEWEQLASQLYEHCDEQVSKATATN